MLRYLTNSLTSVEAMYRNSGNIIMGDFNRFNITSISRHFKIKQLVKFATRGLTTLDLILRPGLDVEFQSNLIRRI